MFQLNVNIFLSHTCLAVHLSLNITMAHFFPALLSVWSVPRVLDMEVAGEPAKGETPQLFLPYKFLWKKEKYLKTN